MFNPRTTMIATALLLGSMSAGAMAQPAPMVTMNTPRAAKRGLFGGIQLATQYRWNYNGPGTTMAQQKRAAKKARNVKRHRAACRK